MSVAIVVKSGVPAAPRLIPLAPEAVFDEVWCKSAASLGLRWIPLFQTGVDPSFEDLADIRSEFQAMTRHFQDCGDIECAVRARGAAEVISECLAHGPPVEVFIG